MADTQAQLRQWEQLKQQAVDGDLRMETGIGEALRKRCSTLLDELDKMLRTTTEIAYLSGFGGLPSAIQLQTKFEQKAVNGGPHDPNDSAAKRIEQHIEIVKLMYDTYSVAIGKLEATDHAAARQMNTQTEGVS